MIVPCPNCRTELEVPEANLGQSVLCPACRCVLVASAGPGAAVPPRPQAPPQPQGPPQPQAPSPTFGPPPPPMPPGHPFFVSPMPRAKWAVGLAALAILAGLVSCYSSWLQVRLLERVQAGEEVTTAEAEANDSREAATGLVGGGATIAAIVLFFVWTYRAYKNLRPLGAGQVRFSPGGSVGWHFCPILSLWKPCQAMNDIWVGSQGRPLSRYAVEGGGFVAIWWIVWLIDNVLGHVVLRSALGTARMEQPPIGLLISNTWTDIGSGAASIVSWALTMVLVWVISTRQVARRMGLATPPAA